ncbi:hypothetical protein [Paenibacillus sp. GSMTC-2017]|uniref:hypothetical protein n=1 Tax=Paenibacillus sp. GSMTC-2017 TaxID=2794350 RepID=UPI001E473586|nr:hypothetical protein [Paenibacillus sp. GSMTC-2017]
MKKILINLFIECQTENEARTITHEVIDKLGEIVASFHISLCEEYWRRFRLIPNFIADRG